MLFIDHLILLSVLDAALDGRGMPSHGKRMKLVGLQHNTSILGERWKQYQLLYSFFNNSDQDICYKINTVLLKIRLNRIMNSDLRVTSREVEKVS